jgi:hypothetical protein
MRGELKFNQALTILNRHKKAIAFLEIMDSDRFLVAG